MCIYIDRETGNITIVGGAGTIKMFKDLFDNLVRDAREKGILIDEKTTIHNPSEIVKRFEDETSTEVK